MATQLTPEFLADYEVPMGLALSPSGSHVAYGLRSLWVHKANQDNITASLWIAEVSKEHSARQLTSGKSHDFNPQFSPDGTCISFISDRGTPPTSSKSDSAMPAKGLALYLMPTEGREKDVVPLINTQIEKGMYQYAWSPDGKMIAFTNSDEKTAQQRKMDEEKDDAINLDTAYEFNRLRILDLETKHVKTLVELDAHVWNFVWNLSGTTIAFHEWNTPNFDDILSESRVKIVNVKGGNIDTLCTLNIAFTQPTVWAGNHIYWTVDTNEESQMGKSIYRVSCDARNSKAERVYFDEEACAQEVKPCGEHVVLYRQHGLIDHLIMLEGWTILEANVDISRGCEVVLKGDKTIVALIKAPDTGAPVEVFSIVDEKECQLSNHSETLAQMNLAESFSFSCRSEDGTVTDGILSVPTSLSGKKGPHPAILYPHGGPYHRMNRGSDNAFSFDMWFLSLGYVVLQPNYLGSSGRGKKHAEAVLGDFTASYSGCVDLLKKVISDGVIDKKRVAIVGWSYGGFLAYLAPTRDSTFHFAASIAGAGICDWDTMAFTSNLPAYWTKLNGSAPWLCEANDTRGRKSSPIWHMQDIRTPFLILHGQNDERTPVEQAMAFHRGLKARGMECETVIYPREGHGWPMGWERQHYVHMLNKMKGFLEKHLH